MKKENAEKRVVAAQKVRILFSAFFLESHHFVLQKKEEAEVAKLRAEEKAARSYDLLFNVEEDFDAPKPTGKAIEEDFM